MKYLSLKLIFAIAFLASTALAQPGQAHYSAAAHRMFDGEVLTFDGKLNKIIRGISVAEMTFTASSPRDGAEMVVKAEAVSKGTLLKLFRFSFLQRYESTIDLNNFRIQKTVKHDVQKERVRDSEAVFDYKDRRVTYVETDPKDANRAPRRIASELSDQVHDMISAIYSLRLQALSVGKRLELSISDSGLVYRVPVIVAAKESQKTVIGKVTCFRVEPEIFGKGRLIEQDGKMVIWMTEDERHLPIHAQIDTSFGKIDIKLRSVSKPS